MIRLDRKNKIEKLLAKLSRHAARDISLLSCSIFGETHAFTMRNKFQADFSTTLWIIRGRQIIFYRLLEEYDKFSKKVGERFRKNKNYAGNIANKLIELTNWFNDFLEKNKKLDDLLSKAKMFFDNYREFFAYHQAVYWGGDYLSKFDSNQQRKKKLNQIIKVLNSAYKYNELVVPHIEEYFKNLKISHLLHDEINKNVYRNIKIKPKNRSLLFIGGKQIILSEKLGRQLETEIERSQKSTIKKMTEVKGLSVSAGLFKGRVNLITTLNKLNLAKKNSVLVTTMTRPQFNEIIKKVGAIVTDEGGQLCHASILAREFNIPCIVGTKIATKILKDGDLVEVDAEKGTVRIIKKAK